MKKVFWKIQSISSVGALVKYKDTYIYKAEFTKKETKELIQKVRKICGEGCVIAFVFRMVLVQVYEENSYKGKCNFVYV